MLGKVQIGDFPGGLNDNKNRPFFMLKEIALLESSIRIRSISLKTDIRAFLLDVEGSFWSWNSEYHL